MSFERGKCSLFQIVILLADVLKAYAMQTSPEAPELVRNLLKHMESLSERYPSVKPDYNCHNMYLFSLTEAVRGSRISIADAAELGEEYIEMMLQSDDDNVRPDKWSFNIVLALLSRNGSDDAVLRAEKLLCRLEEYHRQSGFSEKTRPNANTYNTLMNCISRSRIPRKITKAMNVLEKMRSVGKDNPSARPDAVSYGIAMNIHARSRRTDAPLKVEALLLEMSNAYNETGDKRMKPNRRSINACLGKPSRTPTLVRNTTC